MSARMLALVLVVLSGLGMVCGGGGCSGPERGPAASGSAFRGIWVTRWDYRSEERIRKIMADAAGLGLTDVFFQVRGQGDAFYRSGLEPWGEELTRDLPAGATGPSFDPLAVAVREGHARGLRVHGWVNVMPLWRGEEGPRSAHHPLVAHPEWRLFNAKGEPQALHEGYVIGNPVLPSFQDHVVAVCRDIVMRYDVDGLHLDYVRFVSEGLEEGAVYPGDDRSLSMFREATGARGIELARERELLRDWVRGRITDLVVRIREEAVSAREGTVLTAAVWRRPDLARATQLQDAAAWLRDGVLDRAIPMIYTADDDRFEEDLRAWLAVTGGRPVAAGVGVYKHDRYDQTRRQLAAARRLGAAGFCLFAYSTLFESDAPDQDRSEEAARERAARRDVVRAYLSGRV